MASKSQKTRKTFVLDTSVLLADPGALYRFAEHEVIIPIAVIGELESKRDHPELGYFARAALRALDLLPAWLADKLAALTPIREDGVEVNVAISYGGRREIVDAVKSYMGEEVLAGHSLTDAAAKLTAEDISKFLYTAGQPDPELLIRTSGEQRLGGFLLWQSALSEFYFCEAYWPDFRRVDFLRALRSYSVRQRRFGS